MPPEERRRERRGLLQMNILADRLRNIPPYLFMELRGRIRQMQASGTDFISLAVGDPVEPTPAYIIESLRRAALDPVNHQYPTDEQKGMQAFRAAVARWYIRKYGVSLDPETEVLGLNGSKEGIHNLLMAIVNPGEVVMVTDPGYPGYLANIPIVGGEPYPVPLCPQNGYLPDLDGIPESICRRAKVFFFNYPNNPTGACATSAFFRRLVEWAEARQVFLVHDNPYSEIVLPGAEKLSLLQFPGAKDVCVEFNSLSKTYNMTGWRIGMAAGNPAIIQAMSKFKENVTSGIFNAIQLASIKALDDGDEDIARMIRVYARRRAMVLEEIWDWGLDTAVGRGTFYLWLPVPNGMSSIDFTTHLLEKARVLVTAGSAFGKHGEGFFRLSLTVPDDRLACALNRMRRTLKGC
jgi:LL-diaminopimelate aminotransferase